ncbi:hypothetical protein JZ751_011759 [Albula glossodonta]|uniref:Uncharacterized protein n=1 Tax=Albula glossodonta TaxID=121402 RepID=A0A8T2PQI5_9TELE|nr:hypothetical protein JZ751_011759 [Albula glossodonta]
MGVLDDTQAKVAVDTLTSLTATPHCHPCHLFGVSHLRNVKGCVLWATKAGSRQMGKLCQKHHKGAACWRTFTPAHSLKY